MRYKLVLLLFCGFLLHGHAQDKIQATLSADFVSQYIWRGMELGQVSMQPTLGLEWKGLSLKAFGNVGLNRREDPKEIDLTASYTTGGLTLGVVDYWCNSPDERYFYYAAHGTSHLFEAFAVYDFGVLSASWQTIFAGNDGENKEGKQAYSSYLEVSAPFKLATCDWTASIGLVPYYTTYYETTGFAVTNISLQVTKPLKITENFTLPVFTQIAANPRTQKAYMIFGFTLNVI